MANSFGSRLKHAWNAFFNKDPTEFYQYDVGPSYSYRPDRVRLTRGNERSIITSIFNRISLDVASINIQHVRLDENKRFVEEMNSGLNYCLNTEANIDQTGRAFIQDIVMSMMDDGCVAIVPVDTDVNPTKTGSYDIETMRTGKILDWYPEYVKVEVYNQRTGQKEDLMLPKKIVCIIENPLYAVVNTPNSTLQRLIRKLNLLDSIDEQSNSGKLDLIIQLPYTIKSPARYKQAENRRADIEKQLTGTKYGIAYTDATERIVQLNRPIENNLLPQIENLMNQLYSQLGITQSIMDGTADEKTMLNYYNRTIEPIISAIVDEMKRKFLTKTARTQRQSIIFFRDPFKLVPVSELAEIADKFTRNEVMTSNEIRQIIGMKPSNDPKADELVNSNNIVYNQSNAIQDDMTREDYDEAIADIDDLDEQLASLEKELEHSELLHYASPYYDPEKAHEYYMRTRELKGRKSTSGLNEEGKSAAQYIREQLQNERKELVDSHKQQTDSTIETNRVNKQKAVEFTRNQTTSKIDSLREKKKADTEAYRNATQGKIDNLRESLKNMPKEQKELNRDKIQKQIDALREDNKKERLRLAEDFKSSSVSLRDAQKTTTSNLNNDFKEATSRLRSDHRTEKARLKEEYDQKYVNELDKIKADAKFQKVTTKKKK